MTDAALTEGATAIAGQLAEFVGAAQVLTGGAINEDYGHDEALTALTQLHRPIEDLFSQGHWLLSGADFVQCRPDLVGCDGHVDVLNP